MCGTVKTIVVLVAIISMACAILVGAPQKASAQVPVVTTFAPASPVVGLVPVRRGLFGLRRAYLPVVSYPAAPVAVAHPIVAAQPITVARPFVVSQPVTTFYAPAARVTTVMPAAPITTFYAPAAPVTTYYAPAAPVTTFYAPAAPVTTVMQAAPITTFYPPAAPAASSCSCLPTSP